MSVFGQNWWKRKDFGMVSKTGHLQVRADQESMMTFPGHTTVFHYESWSLLCIFESPWTVQMENRQDLSWLPWLESDWKYQTRSIWHFVAKDICSNLSAIQVLKKKLKCIQKTGTLENVIEWFFFENQKFLVTVFKSLPSFLMYIQ